VRAACVPIMNQLKQLQHRVCDIQGYGRCVSHVATCFMQQSADVAASRPPELVLYCAGCMSRECHNCSC